MDSAQRQWDHWSGELRSVPHQPVIPMKFCPRCAQPVVRKIPEGDHLIRFVCETCNLVHYDNPRTIVGCIPAWEDQVLLCRRAIHPRRGYWTLPAGFLENGETTRQGAVRETLEEANARVEIDALYRLFDLPHIHQIYVFFRARLLDLDFSPGTESLETRLFSEADVPWGELAFHTVRLTLQDYFADRRRDDYPPLDLDVRPGVR